MLRRTPYEGGREKEFTRRVRAGESYTDVKADIGSRNSTGTRLTANMGPILVREAKRRRRLVTSAALRDISPAFEVRGIVGGFMR